LRFEIVARDSTTLARVGLLHTPHGIVETPAFMPVGTAGTVKGMAQEDLEELGVRLLLANTYHLYLRPGQETIRDFGGLHRFMGWPHAILTDSGGFQIMSLKGLGRVTEDGFHFRSHLDGSSHFLPPERAVEVQLALGADIIMTLDECVKFPSSHETLRRAVKLTGRWARRAKEFWLNQDSGNSGVGSRDSQSWGFDIRNPKSEIIPPETRVRSPESRNPNPETQSRKPVLFGIIQGGTDKALRRESAEEICDIGFEGYAVGGLSVGEPKNETYDIAGFTADLLPADRPRYLMGVGTPADLAECVARGIDLFDCVMPTRNARNATVFTSQGKLVIKSARYARDQEPIDPACGCRVCRRYSRGYIRHLFVAGEMLAAILTTHHNLHFYLDTMRQIRQAIRAGDFEPFLSKARVGS
jgi:queuine tRNA-ribosyltransferase